MRTKAEIRALGGKDELLAELCRINPAWTTRKSVKNMNMDDLVDLIREEESTDSPPPPPRRRAETVEIIEVHTEPGTTVTTQVKVKREKLTLRKLFGKKG